MLRRFLLLLMLLAATPVAAQPACHGPPAVRTHHDTASHHREHRAPAAAVHDCIGCIPPEMLIGGRIAARIEARASAPVTLAAAADTPAPSQPTTPPPRRG